MRTHYFIIFIVCAGMLGTALYLQLFMNMDPCPLCVFQRMALSVIAIIALIGFLHNPEELGSRIYSLFLTLAGLVSLGIGGYHVWFLNEPANEFASCGPGMGLMVDKIIAYLPQGQVTETLFRSIGSCGVKSTPELFGIALPELVFPAIVALVVFIVWGLFKPHNH